MKIFRGKYINDFFKDLITRYSINEKDFDKLVSIKETMDEIGKNIRGYDEDVDDEFYDYEWENWEEKYNDLRNKYRERFFETSKDDVKDEIEEEKEDDGEDYEDVTIDEVLYEDDENKEEK